MSNGNLVKSIQDDLEELNNRVKSFLSDHDVSIRYATSLFNEYKLLANRASSISGNGTTYSNIKLVIEENASRIKRRVSSTIDAQLSYLQVQKSNLNQLFDDKLIQEPRSAYEIKPKAENAESENEEIPHRIKKSPRLTILYYLIKHETIDVKKALSITHYKDEPNGEANLNATIQSMRRHGFVESLERGLYTKTEKGERKILSKIGGVTIKNRPPQSSEVSNSPIIENYTGELAHAFKSFLGIDPLSEVSQYVIISHENSVRKLLTCSPTANNVQLLNKTYQIFSILPEGQREAFGDIMDKILEIDLRNCGKVAPFSNFSIFTGICLGLNKEDGNKMSNFIKELYEDARNLFGNPNSLRAYLIDENTKHGIKS